MTDKLSNETQLDALKKLTTVVADTGDFESIMAYEPQDATTNPTLIYKAVQMEKYARLLEQAAEEVETLNLAQEDKVDAIIDHLLVIFGAEILNIIPGRVSTEVDARLSFDTEATIAKARHLIKLYEKKGIDKSRILIKIASTWEGLTAAKTLESEGIHCNLTLLFSLAQAVVAGDNKVTLISPFVGRIMDWYKEKTGKTYSADEDPGVESVTQIYHYLKHYGYTTEVMGASFRNKGEILHLAGCDLLTISPNLLQELKDSTEPVEAYLTEEKAKSDPVAKLDLDEKTFRWHMNADPMATAKLAEGIRSFASDTEDLCDLIENEILK